MSVGLKDNLMICLMFQQNDLPIQYKDHEYLKWSGSISKIYLNL